MRVKIVVCTIVGLLVIGVVLLLSHPAFGPRPLGGASAAAKASPHYRDGRFHNEVPTQQFTGQRGSGLSAMWHFLTDRTNERVPKKPVEIERNDIRQAVADRTKPSSRDLFVWFGHSSYLFTLGGRTVLVDPLLKMEFPSSLMMKPFPGTDYYTPADMPDIDMLVITHEHWDHLDYANLRELRPKVRHAVCPLGIADYLIRWGYSPEIITEMDWYDQSTISDFDLSAGRSTSDSAIVVHCLPTRHFSNRLFGANQTLWASFLLDFNGKKVYIGGDGGYDDRFRRIHKQFGMIDLAIMENGQYNTNWAYIHMLPEDLEQAMMDLQAKQYITVHHDKFSLAPHAWSEPDSVARSIAGRHSSIHIIDNKIGHITEW